MKVAPVHLIVLAVAAVAVYYFMKKAPAVGSGATSSPVSGTQTAVPDNTFNNILGMVTEAFKLGTTALGGTKPAGTVAQTDVSSFSVPYYLAPN